MFVRLLVKAGVDIVNVLLIHALLCQPQALTEALEMNDLAGTQELNDVVHVRVVAEPQNVVVGNTRFLFSGQILRQVGDHVAGNADGAAEEKEEKVPLTAEEEAYLKEYLESRKDNDPALFVGSKKPNSRLTKTGIEDIIRRIGEKAGVENAHPHRFRRTALTNALNRGMPLQEAMIFAGHAKSETTMRYCTVNQEGVRYHHFKYLSA